MFPKYLFSTLLWTQCCTHLRDLVVTSSSASLKAKPLSIPSSWFLLMTTPFLWRHHHPSFWTCHYSKLLSLFFFAQCVLNLALFFFFLPRLKNKIGFWGQIASVLPLMSRGQMRYNTVKGLTQCSIHSRHSINANYVCYHHFLVCRRLQ